MQYKTILSDINKINNKLNSIENELINLLTKKYSVNYYKYNDIDELIHITLNKNDILLSLPNVNLSDYGIIDIYIEKQDFFCKYDIDIVNMILKIKDLKRALLTKKKEFDIIISNKKKSISYYDIIVNYIYSYNDEVETISNLAFKILDNNYFKNKYKTLEQNIYDKLKICEDYFINNNII